MKKVVFVLSVLTILAVAGLYASKKDRLTLPFQTNDLASQARADQEELTERAEPNARGPEDTSEAGGARPASLVGSEQGRGSNDSLASTEEMPSAISEESAKRVKWMEGDYAKSSPQAKDIFELHAIEGRDKSWSPEMEANFDTHLRSRGKGYGGLEVSEVNCSKTVCYISAVVKNGISPKSASADWQGLINQAYGDEWFRGNFADANTTLGGDQNGTIYISTFIRK